MKLKVCPAYWLRAALPLHTPQSLPSPSKEVLRWMNRSGLRFLCPQEGLIYSSMLGNFREGRDSNFYGSVNIGTQVTTLPGVRRGYSDSANGVRVGFSVGKGKK